MFENLRSAFREAVENFKEELNRDHVPEAVDRLLREMHTEVTDAKTRLHDLEAGIRRALAEAERERREEATCERREKMAQRIGDEETERVAAEFRRKHARSREVLEAKAVALQRELEVRKAEIEEMLDQLREAQSRRDALAAEVGRSGARDSIREADDLFDELDRMADRIRDEDDSSGDGDEIFGDSGADFDSEAEPSPPLDVDTRLAELKRKMGRE
jgi:phage shock protein A